MKLGLLSICVALMLSCVLSSFSTVKARHMGLNPHAIHSSVQPDLHHKNEEQSFFQDAYVRRDSKMKKERLSVASSENKPAATEFKVPVQDSPGHNRAHKIKGPERLPSDDHGTQIFSRHRKKSANKSAPAKKDIAMMAFTPSSSGHSPGIGHDSPPDPRL